MPENELEELHEHAEEAHHDPSLKPVSLTMAVLAVLVALVTLLGHRTHIEDEHITKMPRDALNRPSWRTP